MILTSKVNYNGAELNGLEINNQVRKLADLEGLFSDKQAYLNEDLSRTVYKVSSYLPVPNETEGGLFFGITYLYPGKVGNEYFFTKGHFHIIENRAEFYWCIEGSGMLLLMDKSRNTWAEEMRPGSLHYINGSIAHRVANTGATELSFGACWPSDAGHDYESIAKSNFSKKLIEVDGVPVLI